MRKKVKTIITHYIPKVVLIATISLVALSVYSCRPLKKNKKFAKDTKENQDIVKDTQDETKTSPDTSAKEDPIPSQQEESPLPEESYTDTPAPTTSSPQDSDKEDPIIQNQDPTTPTQEEYTTNPDETIAPLEPTTDQDQLAATAPDQTPEEKDQDTDQSSIKNIIDYQADTMSFDIQNSQVSLLGNSDVIYGNNRLIAHEVAINWHKNELFAASKETNGIVELQDKINLILEGSEYFAEKIKLNFESQRAVLYAMFTRIEEALVRAKKIKRDYEEVYHIQDMSYTTCNLPHPHFAIKAQKAKLYDKREFVSGPVHLAFSDVQSILFFFGLFYFPNKKHGLIPPRYGGTSDKGIHIKEIGYYWNFDDIVDLALTTDIHSGGTLGINTESFYKKRYHYNGNILYKRSKDITFDNTQSSWQFAWKHTTEDNRDSTFIADINLKNEIARKEDATKSGDSQPASSQSNIKYTHKLPEIPFYSIGTKINYTKNFVNDETTLTLPSIILYTHNIYPLRIHNQTDHWYQNIHIRHSVEFKNKITTKTDYLDFYKTSDWPDLYKRKKYAIKHTIPLKTNISIGYFNLIPSIEYRERWYWDHTDHLKEPRKVKKFERVWDYEPSIELTTTIYGKFIYTKNRSIDTIRHQFIPSLILVYTPSFEKEYWQKVNGTPKSRFENHIFETPSDKQKLILYGTLRNALDMRLKPQTGQEESSKTPLLEGCDAKSGYDFLAKDFPVQDIELKARTRLFDKTINIELSRIYDPYTYKELPDHTYKKIQKLAINNEQGLGHLKEARLTISTEFKSQAESQDPLIQIEKIIKQQYAFKNPDLAAQEYVDFYIPWTFTIKYDYTYKSKDPSENKKNKVISAENRLNISEKWVLGLQTGYDIVEEEIVKSITKISAYRDLHCWQMTFSWLPISPTQYFQFSIGVKATVLESLKYTRGDKPYKYV